MLRIERELSFDFLSPEYKALFERSDATAFQHPVWMNSLFHHLISPSGRSAKTLVGRTADGQLGLVLPMMDRLGSRFFEFIEAADMAVSDYNMAVVDPSVVAFLKGSAKASAPLRGVFAGAAVWVRRVRADAVETMRLLGFSESSPMGYSSHEVALEAPFETWRAHTLEPTFLRFLSRKRRRLERQAGLRLREVREAADIKAAFELMRRFRAARKYEDVLLKPTFFEFYTDVAFKGLAGGLTRTFVLEVGDVPRAALFGISHKGRFAFLLLGFDFTGMRNASLGLLLIDMVLEDCIARGDKIFDFTIGDQAYKRGFRPTSQPMYGVWGGPRLLTWLAHAAYSQFNRLRYKRVEDDA